MGKNEDFHVSHFFFERDPIAAFIGEGLALARDQDELNHGSPVALLADGCFLLSLFMILWIQFLRFLKAAIKLFSFLELNVFPDGVRWGRAQSRLRGG